ncbi:hypothetical protein BTR22_13330 [Alkalihalophilus pseudofirmus]|uniref:SRPBCC family protein n=1 Tax=Alkalihalophilus pseudofirmus TaxID=79885 RepID=UPI000950FE52|nr:hypothetical protein BTR22_13330 [Alkalihalophilus pseudofirmus]
MDTYIFTYETTVDAPIEEVWSFFHTAENLVKITSFPTITLHSDPETRKGNTIRMKMGLGPVKADWHSYIQEVKPHEYFVDVGVKLPYPLKSWRHTHSFVKREDSTVMKDLVEIQSPLPTSILRPALHGMFRGRADAVRRHFNRL